MAYVTIIANAIGTTSWLILVAILLVGVLLISVWCYSTTRYTCLDAILINGVSTCTWTHTCVIQIVLISISTFIRTWIRVQKVVSLAGQTVGFLIDASQAVTCTGHAFQFTIICIVSSITWLHTFASNGLMGDCLNLHIGDDWSTSTGKTYLKCKSTQVGCLINIICR